MGERFTDVVGDWVRLSACESCGGREFRKEFARLFICRKGERPLSAVRKRGAVVEVICWVN